MAHLITSDDYRFGRTHDKRVSVRARGALGRVNGFLKNMIEAIADFEDAPHRARTRAPRFSLRPVQQ